MSADVISCPNGVRPRGAMADVIGAVPRKVTALIKPGMGGEEDAQSLMCVTAQSLVHVPFVSSCHWGPHVCAHLI